MKNHKNFYITYGILSILATLISIFLYSTPEAISLTNTLNKTASDTINFIEVQMDLLFLSIGTVVAMILMFLASRIVFCTARKRTQGTLLINPKDAFLPVLGISCCMLFLGCILTKFQFFIGQAVIHYPIFVTGFKKRTTGR